MTIAEALAIAIQYHQGGRLPAAETIYRQILAAEPDHADANHLLGVAASQMGRHELAAELIGRAIRAEANVALFHKSLGETYRACIESQMPSPLTAGRSNSTRTSPRRTTAWALPTAQGRLDEAVQCWQRALELKLDSAETYYNLGLAFKDLGKLEDAIAHWHRALALKPNSAETHNNLGNALREQGKLEEAVACYHRALGLKPGFAKAHYNLGNALRDQGDLAQADLSYRRALDLAPDYAEAHSNLGHVLRDQGKLNEAIRCWRRSLALRPGVAETQYNLGVALHEQRLLDEAIVCFDQALKLKPDFAEAYNNLGNVRRDQGHLPEAVACCRRALALKPDLVEAHNNLGNALKDMGQFDDAIASYRRALELKPDFAKAHYNLGSAWEQTGDFRGAEDSFRAALRHDSRHALAHYNLATLLRDRLPQEDVAAQRRLLKEVELTDSQRLLLCFGLAQVLDAQGDYAGAAAQLVRANSLQLSEWRERGQAYDPQAHASFVTRMIAACTPDYFVRVRNFGSDSELPVFVVGLPRSGTTLVEQILASHSQLFGAGETKLVGNTLAAPGGQGEDAIEGMNQLHREAARRLAARHLEELRGFSPSALRIADKMPENYLYLGLLATLFPRAKLIHCRRDLRDVAVSCWMTHFQDVRWANDLEHIAFAISRLRADPRALAESPAPALPGSGLRGNRGRPGRHGPTPRGLVRSGLGARMP